MTNQEIDKHINDRYNKEDFALEEEEFFRIIFRLAWEQAAHKCAIECRDYGNRYRQSSLKIGTATDVCEQKCLLIARSVRE